MKQNGLSLDQMIQWKRDMDNGSSQAIFIDSQTGKVYGAKSVTEYVSGYFAELKNGQLLEPKNQPITGLRSINGMKLGAGVNQLVYALRLSVDLVLAAQDEDSLKGAAFAGVAPGYVKNGEFTMTSGGELVRTTGSDLHNAKASTGNDADFKDVVPFNLREETNFQATFTLAGLAVAKHAYKLEWRAVEFVEISKV